MLLDILRSQCPNWRYKEVEKCLRSRPIRKPAVDDYYVSSYLKVVKELSRTTDTTAKMLSLCSDPELKPFVEVYSLTTNPFGAKTEDQLSPGSAFNRAILEALVLCDEDPKEIADLTGLSLKAVESYEMLYFDLRGRPKYWVVAQILHPIINSFNTGNFDAMLKFAAVACGKSAIDNMLFDGNIKEEDFSKIRASIKGWNLIKAAGASVMIPVNSYNNLDFMRDVQSAYVDEERLKIQKESASVQNESGAEGENDRQDIVNSLLGAHDIRIASKYNEEDKELFTDESEPLISKTVTQEIEKIAAAEQ